MIDPDTIQLIALIVQLIVLAVLITYLFSRITERLYAAQKAWRGERQWPCAAFDASPLKQQMQQLRKDHLAATHPRLHQAFHWRGLVAAIRRTVTNLAFFHRDEDLEHEMQKHGPG